MKLLILAVVAVVMLVAFLSLKSLGEGTEEDNQAKKGCTGNCVSCKEHCSTPTQQKK